MGAAGKLLSERPRQGSEVCIYKLPPRSLAAQRRISSNLSTYADAFPSSAIFAKVAS